MVVNFKAKKRLASRVTGVGIHRIKFEPDHLEDIADAITRANIRSLITANTIKIKPFTGTSKGRAHTKKAQRNKRGTKQGSKQGRGCQGGKEGVLCKEGPLTRKIAKDCQGPKGRNQPGVLGTLQEDRWKHRQEQGAS